jgi:hypothetical protein
MLNKRTNILFDERLWQDLTKKAKVDKTSVGKLVRQAVKQSYFAEDDQKTIAKAIEKTKRIRKVFKGRVNYKELINYGRKY